MRVLVRDVMSRGVLKLRKDQTVKEVARLFLDRIIDGAPVVDDDGKVIGVFTKTHLMRAMGKPLDMPIERLMNRNVISIGETMPIEEAMNIPVGRLPVVDSQGKMVGWLTRTDLAAAFLEHYKQSIEGLGRIIDSNSHGIMAIDGEGKITVFNKTGEKLWGIGSENILGRPIGEVFPVIKTDIDGILKTGEPVCYELQVDDAPYIMDMKPIMFAGRITGATAEFYKSESHE